MIGNKGLTLLEVMIAMLILSIGLLSMASLVGTGHRVLAISDQASLAAQLARNKMEGLRSIHPLPTKLTQEEVVGTGMTRTWSIAQSENDPKLWVITVEAFPTKEPNRSVVLKSLLFY
ncbi:MAG: prepilin-type N-terminal cleavage/methylation domain-containing protein [Nitrospirae bacterium]|nr:prepilin-type N-terminal cleavage/methylation domain-containing protein [Candidatus Troglogloeales bacterium]